jgi:hypothetical protein
LREGLNGLREVLDGLREGLKVEEAPSPLSGTKEISSLSLTLLTRTEVDAASVAAFVPPI